MPKPTAKKDSSRVKKRTFSTSVLPEKQDALRVLAALRKCNIEDLVDEALDLLFEKYDKEVASLLKIPRAS